MNNNGFDISKHEEQDIFKEIIKVLRENLLLIIGVTIIFFIGAFIRAYNQVDIYTASAKLKMTNPQNNSVLQSPLLAFRGGYGVSDRFIANEIEILKSYPIRLKVAEALVDTFLLSDDPNKYSLILNLTEANSNFYFLTNLFGSNSDQNEISLRSKENIASILGVNVFFSQQKGVDYLIVTVRSPSNYEAQLIANIYAKEYKNLNLLLNREQHINVREFLDEQRTQKLADLEVAEENLKQYQERGGIIQIDQQAQNLVGQLSDFEAQLNANNIEIRISEQRIEKYRQELSEQDPNINNYLESVSNEPYIRSLQQKIAELKTQKDLVLANNEARAVRSVIQDFDKRIDELQQKVDEKMETYKTGLFATSPQEIKNLTQKILEESIKLQSLRLNSQEVGKLVRSYERKFNELPKRTIDLARLQREKESYEKLYLLIEEKYQEAIINEQSTPGNVTIVDPARLPYKPSAPNRQSIIITGLLFGLAVGVGLAFTKNFLNNKIRTPEDIKAKGIDVVGWIPRINVEGSEFIFADQPNSIPSESFRSLRTRIQFSIRNNKKVKRILVTSSKAQEGKTTVSSNLAGSFALANKRTVVLDCDLRKPRIHKIFNEKRIPGFTDYFFGETSFESIIRKSKDVENLYHITAGTIPPNPSEIISSEQMKELLSKLSNEFDYVVIDSPPCIAVTDAEILSRLVDASILVASADITEKDLLQKSVELLGNESFMGVLLNNFSYKKSGYGSYYKYYYYYSHPTNGDATKTRKKKKRSKSLA